MQIVSSPLCSREICQHNYSHSFHFICKHILCICKKVTVHIVSLCESLSIFLKMFAHFLKCFLCLKIHFLGPLNSTHTHINVFSTSAHTHICKHKLWLLNILFWLINQSAPVPLSAANQWAPSHQSNWKMFHCLI